MNNPKSLASDINLYLNFGGKDNSDEISRSSGE